MDQEEFLGVHPYQCNWTKLFWHVLTNNLMFLTPTLINLQNKINGDKKC
jgi:hypothetical protein